MMKEKKIRLLRADEIDVRVGAIYEKGITLLLYKDARVDMNILDETFGPMNWKRKHVMYGDVMFCEVMIREEESGRWVSKMDVGTPSFSEPLKGAASDAFKRACTNLGIGRELYTAPFIWIPIDKINIKEERGKKIVKDSFHVQSIHYEEEKRCIDGIVIVNQNGQVAFQRMNLEPVPKATSIGLNEAQTAMLLAELKRTGFSLASVLKKHNLTKISDMSPQLWENAMEALKDTPDKAA